MWLKLSSRDFLFLQHCSFQQAITSFPPVGMSQNGAVSFRLLPFKSTPSKQGTSKTRERERERPTHTHTHTQTQLESLESSTKGTRSGTKCCDFLKPENGPSGEKTIQGVLGGYESKLNHQHQAGFSPCFYLSGQSIWGVPTSFDHHSQCLASFSCLPFTHDIRSPAPPPPPCTAVAPHRFLRHLARTRKSDARGTEAARSNGNSESMALSGILFHGSLFLEDSEAMSTNSEGRPTHCLQLGAPTSRVLVGVSQHGEPPPRISGFCLASVETTPTKPLSKKAHPGR